MVLVCPAEHRLARRKRVNLAELAGEDFVAFEAGLAIRRHIDRFLRERAVDVRVAMAFDNIEFIKRGVETGAGVSILPEPTVRREVRAGLLHVVPVTDLDLARSLCIIQRHRRFVSPAMKAFVEILKTVEPKDAPSVAGPSISGAA
jgi:DNA-binding transcriptional LysR family regulator